MPLQSLSYPFPKPYQDIIPNFQIDTYKQSILKNTFENPHPLKSQHDYLTLILHKHPIVGALIC